MMPTMGGLSRSVSMSMARKRSEVLSGSPPLAKDSASDWPSFVWYKNRFNSKAVKRDASALTARLLVKRTECFATSSNSLSSAVANGHALFFSFRCCEILACSFLFASLPFLRGECQKPVLTATGNNENWPRSKSSCKLSIVSNKLLLLPRSRNVPSNIFHESVFKDSYMSISDIEGSEISVQTHYRTEHLFQILHSCFPCLTHGSMFFTICQ